ncbi:hypothetical protein OY671_009521, partial [Metschnikowia pulcherrima]
CQQIERQSSNEFKDVLVRCRTNHPVPVEDISRSIRDWFEPALSIAEVTTAIAALTAARWLEFDESRQTSRATAAGWSVVARLERPVGYADGWNIFAPPRDFDPDQVAMGGSAGADRDDLNVDMTPEERAAFEAKIEASINTHSGHPTVTVQEWASSVRCRADRPVPVDESIASMVRWFVPVLSAQE